MRRMLLILISVQITKVLPRRHDSSSESIENILYYQDCQHKKETTAQPVARSEPKPDVRAAECPFPKMCCSMSCGDDCGTPQSSFLGRPTGQSFTPIIPVSQPSRPPQKPQIIKGRKKKLQKGKQNVDGRRNWITKEKIKGLISQDEDIRRILKDLVRVTMQKVDLVEMLNNGMANGQKGSVMSESSVEFQG